MQSKKQLIQQYKDYVKDNFSSFTNKKGVRILSYNVQLFKDINQKTSFNRVEQLIIDSDADIILLFEALFVKDNKKIFEEIIKKTKYIYTKYCNDKYGINVLLSKYPIKECQILQLVKDPVKNMSRYAIIATININNKDIKIAGCHLDVFDESEKTRLTQIKQILSKINDEYILLGDLNSLRKHDYTTKEWNYLYNDCHLRNTDAHTLVTDFIESNDFVDAWKLITKTPPKVSVWSMRRVDYIYVGKRCKYSIYNCDLFISDISDHFPLYIDINI